MSSEDWLSYSLQDFVMFGPQVFLRLFTRINQDFWPWTLLAVVAAFAVPFLIMTDRAGARRLVLGLMSVAWVVSGWGFLKSYFGPINWPAEWFGWAFVSQGILLGAIAVFGRVQRSQRPVRLLAVCWFVAVLSLPWLTVVESGEWRALALFGIAPGTTAAAGAMMVALLPGPLRWVYLVVPLLWSLFCASTFWVLQLWWMLALPVATLVSLGVGFWLSPRRAQTPG